MARVYTITEVTKQGMIVSVTIEGKARPVTFNMQTREITSYTGRDVMRFPVGEYQTAAIRNDAVSRLLFECFMTSYKQSLLNGLQKLELFINNPDLLATVNHVSDLPDECPKGYLKWVQENGKALSYDTVEEYKDMKSISQLGKESAEVYQMLFINDGHPLERYDFADWYKELPADLRNKFNKILKVSMKTLSWTLKEDMKKFIRKICMGRDWYTSRNECRPHNWQELLDTERSFAWNTENIAALGKGMWEKNIIATEDKIRKIEELSNDEFVIIVPKTLQDFTDEGNMQRNCVGHFYHNSIADGRNVVYFIRKKETPNRSYITNRYNIDCSHRTEETRKYCNAYNDDDNARELIKEIDKMITSLLFGE